MSLWSGVSGLAVVLGKANNWPHQAEEENNCWPIRFGARIECRRSLAAARCGRTSAGEHFAHLALICRRRRSRNVLAASTGPRPAPAQPVPCSSPTC